MKIINCKSLLVPYNNISFITLCAHILKLQMFSNLLKNYFMKSIKCILLYKLYLWNFKKRKNVLKWSTSLSATYAKTGLRVTFGRGIVYCGVVYCIVVVRSHCIVIVAHELLILFTSLRLLFPMGLTHWLFSSTCPIWLMFLYTKLLFIIIDSVRTMTLN